MIGRRYALTMATLLLAILFLDTHVGRSVPLRVPLSDLPRQLGGWRGYVELAPQEQTRPDVVINRRYTDTTGHILTLYIAYYEREATRAETIGLCGSCELLATGTEALQINGAPLTVNRVLTREHGTESLVVYWFQSAGGAYPYRGKFDQALRVLRYRRSEGALVRITAPLVGGERDTRQHVVAFLEELFPLLRGYFQD